MKKATLRAVLLFIAGLAFMGWRINSVMPDDTVALQSLLDAGNVTLPSGHAPYIITSGLRVSHAFNLNGNTITCNQATGPAIKLNATSASVSNGVLNGGWDYTSAENTAAPYAISMFAASTTVTNVHVTQWAGYGINCGAFGGLSVINCTIDKVGYIGFYFDPETNGLAGGFFLNNLVDRSMLNPATVIFPAVAIRGSTSSGRTISNWVISGNTLKMPYNPSDGTAACIEVRYCNNCTISTNITIAGTIGISAVADTYSIITNNNATSAKTCGIELSGKHLSSSFNSVKSSIQDGFLIDGSSNFNSLTSDTSKSNGQSAFHITQTSNNSTITNCTFQSFTQKVINLQNSDTITFINTSIDGLSHSSSSGLFLDHCPGNISLTACAFKNLTCAITGYSSISGYGSNNIVGLNCTFLSVGSSFCSSFTSPGVFGTNVKFTTYVAPSPKIGLSFKGYQYKQSVIN